MIIKINQWFPAFLACVPLNTKQCLKCLVVLLVSRKEFKLSPKMIQYSILRRFLEKAMFRGTSKE